MVYFLFFNAGYIVHDTTSQLKVSFFVNQQLNTRPQRRKICNNHILTGRVDIAVFSHTVLFESVIMELATGNRHKGHASCQLSGETPLPPPKIWLNCTPSCMGQHMCNSRGLKPSMHIFLGTIWRTCF